MVEGAAKSGGLKGILPYEPVGVPGVVAVRSWSVCKVLCRMRLFVFNAAANFMKKGRCLVGKAVLLSVQPKWCKLITGGEKTIEVRKSSPKLEIPFKVYIYETKTPLRWNKAHNGIIGGEGGFVIGEFVCDKITMSTPGYKDHVAAYWELLDGSCLAADELMDYGKWKFLYGWHISDLRIYDKPLALSEFMKPCVNDLYCEVCAMYSEFEDKCGNWALTIRRAPQSWCYVEERGFAEGAVQLDENVKEE